MRRSDEKEMMDLPGQPKQLLEEDLHNLRVINWYLGGHRTVLRGLGRAVKQQNISRFSLLDIGAGSGDIAVRIAQWARRKRIRADIVALESESVTALAAVRQTQDVPEIAVVRGDAMLPPFPFSSFDFVLASQLLHHFSEEQIIGLLKIWAQIARKAVIVSDLVRHPVAYHGIRIATRLFTDNVMTRTDAPLSVKRAFTVAEWRELFQRAEIGPVRIFSRFPFRILALASLEGRA
jgi:ubiquinone/menaquinone biosynthesis C-methylase UbiE